MDHVTIVDVPATKEGDRVNFPSYPHEVLAVVLSVRDGRLCVLLWKRARSPHRDRWALPGGGSRSGDRYGGRVGAGDEAVEDWSSVELQGVRSCTLLGCCPLLGGPVADDLVEDGS